MSPNLEITYNRMLKLEKISKSLEIDIILRPRSPVFTSSLKRGFIIALSLHVVIGLLFTVQLIKVSNSIKNYSPIYVESDGQAWLSPQALADLENEEVFVRYLGEPPEARLVLSPCHFSAPRQDPSIASKVEKAPAQLFWKKENWILTPAIPLITPRRYVATPIQIKASGGLEKYALIAKKWDDEILKLLTKIKSERYSQTYHVRLDLDGGEIFWYEPVGVSRSRKADQVVERILSALRFDIKDDSEAIDSGYVEITVYKQEASCD